jgi:HSP20 family molecular chaperone IbpA
MSLSIYDESKLLLEELKKRKDLLGLEAILEQLERFVKFTNEKTYPPTSIEKSDNNTIVIYLALAGFTRKQINITLVGCELIVTGKRDENMDKKNFIHQGIAFRSFEKKFLLGLDAKILGAKYSNGMLEITAQLPSINISEKVTNIEIEEEV